ncbi:MAG: hypothetical protein ACO3JG_10835, partial [Luteolibacter sp.]
KIPKSGHFQPDPRIPLFNVMLRVRNENAVCRACSVDDFHPSAQRLDRFDALGGHFDGQRLSEVLNLA